ncbi:hypothetical protein, partial [Ralstonia pseudosolanacearum]|uniref:hypothetical protein n=1 Tax=Ralstonia pseudosolanacearum TaxID=1310165 RepID=UPI003CE7EBC5
MQHNPRSKYISIYFFAHIFRLITIKGGLKSQVQRLESLTKPINKSPADDGASQGEQSEVSLK